MSETLTRAAEDLAWRNYPIPGSAPAVTMARLHAAGDGGFSVLVRFPAGWDRPGPGAYAAAEEVLFLDGAFRMSGADYGPADYGWFPPGYPRVNSSSAGALALAWFSGPTRWSPCDPSAAGSDAGVVRARWPDVPVTASPLGDGSGRLLRDGPEHTSWIVEGLPAGRPSPVDAELFGLEERVWSHAAPGAPLPRLAGPAFCRVRR